MTDDLLLFGSNLDQSLPTESEFEWVTDRVNERIHQVIKDANLLQATELVRSLIKIAKVSGRELARVLHEFKHNWFVFDTQETFEEWADRETGLHPHTIERYVRIESLLTSPEIPETVRQDLADRNLAELFPIANMIEQGFEPTEKEWQTILLQPDETSIRATVREIKSQPPRASSLTLTLDSNGSIWAIKDSMKKFVGSLEISDESPIVKQAIERITRNVGMLK